MTSMFCKHTSHLSHIFCFLLFYFTNAVISQQILPISEFYQGVMNNTFDAVIDVRSFAEWDLRGHIPNATLIEDLHLSFFIPVAELMEGGSCNSEDKVIVIYSRSGTRAGEVIENLLDSGFSGTVYNGQGIDPWEDAGYDLVRTESTDLDCSRETIESSAPSPVFSFVPSSPSLPEPSSIPIIQTPAPSKVFSFVPSSPSLPEPSSIPSPAFSFTPSSLSIPPSPLFLMLTRLISTILEFLSQWLN